jgi:V-type H+-transporting ATPase subunit C
MPSDQSTWLLSVPQDGDSEGLLQEMHAKFSLKSFPTNGLVQLQIPSFKVRSLLPTARKRQYQANLLLQFAQTGTLESLITLSEELPKQDSFFTQTIAKIVDILRNLLNNDPSKLAQHILVEERPIDEYLLNNWSWNEGRYVLHKSLKEIVDTLAKVPTFGFTTSRRGSPFTQRN